MSSARGSFCLCFCVVWWWCYYSFLLLAHSSAPFWDISPSFLSENRRSCPHLKVRKGHSSSWARLSLWYINANSFLSSPLVMLHLCNRDVHLMPQRGENICLECTEGSENLTPHHKSHTFKPRKDKRFAEMAEQWWFKDCFLRWMCFNMTGGWRRRWKPEKFMMSHDESFYR